jgi:hypothetical protein
MEANMQENDLFLIESDRSGNKLSLNGQDIATFATLDAANAEAKRVANRVVPGASLKFDLDFKWTLSDLEIRAATLERVSGEATVRR